MPEAAVDEDDNMLSWEDEIGSSHEASTVEPLITLGGEVAQTLSPKCRRKVAFRARPTPVVGHGSSALSRRHHVHTGARLWAASLVFNTHQRNRRPRQAEKRRELQ